MAREVINVGAAPNDGTGDPIRTAYIKCNNNFGELYSRAQENPPNTLIGTVGDSAGMYAYDSTYFYYCYQDYDGSSIIWAQLEQAGNVTGTQILNGTSSVAIIGSGANVRISVAGTSNVGVWSSSGLTMGGNILPSANATYDLGSSGSQWSSIWANSITASGAVINGDLTVTGNATLSGNIVGDRIQNGTTIIDIPVAGGNTAVTVGGTANVAVFSTAGVFVTGVQSASGNTTGGNLITAGVITATGNATVGNIDTAGLITATGNVTGGNLVTAGSITATGNIQGGNIRTAGLVTATGNIQGGNIRTAGLITATGNIQGGNIRTAGLISATGNITGGNINVSGNIVDTGALAIITASNGNISLEPNGTGLVTVASAASVTGNVTGGNILTAGLVSATGNVSGDFFVGNGSLLTGITVSSGTTIINGTSNVAVAPNGNTTVGVAGTTVATFASSGILAAGVVSATGNVTGGNLITAGLVTATGNVTGGNFVTAGLVTATGNVTGGNFVTAGLISATGNITGGNLNVTGNIVDTGALTIITGSNGNITLAPNGTGVIVINTDIRNGQSNGVGNIGTTSTRFNTVFALATSAQYADLAEYYLADQDYAAGTVVSFGGSQEITQCDHDHDTAVAGVISTRPAYEMNAALTGDHVKPLALAGRVMCLVNGPIKRGQMLVSAGGGRARAEPNPRMGAVIGKALQDFDGSTGTIEIVVGRL